MVKNGFLNVIKADESYNVGWVYNSNTVNKIQSKTCGVLPLGFPFRPLADPNAFSLYKRLSR